MRRTRLLSLWLTAALLVMFVSSAVAQVCSGSGDSSTVSAAGVHEFWFRSSIGTGLGTSMPALAAGDVAVLGRYGALKSYLAICVHRAGGANEVWYAHDITVTNGATTAMGRDFFVDWGSAANDVEVLGSVGSPTPYTCSSGVTLSAWSYNGYTLYQFGDAGRDFLTGGDGADRICGGTQGDSLAGSAGNDTLDGWEQGDVLSGDYPGQSGTDLLWGYSGGDYVDDSSTTSSLDQIRGEVGNDCLEDDSGSWNFMSCGSGTNDVTYFNGGASVPSDCETRYSGLQTYCRDFFVPSDA